MRNKFKVKRMWKVLFLSIWSLKSTFIGSFWDVRRWQASLRRLHLILLLIRIGSAVRSCLDRVWRVSKPLCLVDYSPLVALLTNYLALLGSLVLLKLLHLEILLVKKHVRIAVNRVWSQLVRHLLTSVIVKLECLLERYRWELLWWWEGVFIVCERSCRLAKLDIHLLILTSWLTNQRLIVLQLIRLVLDHRLERRHLLVL